MKKFVFTLQSWYDMQLGLEKQHKLELKNIEAELTKRQNELLQLGRDFDRAKNEYLSAVTEGVGAPRVKDFGLYFDSLKAAMAAVQLEIARLEREKEQRMQKLIHTRKEIKLLDKLRETQHAEYMDNAKKQHDKFVDDVVSFNVTTS
jgi:flagellar export protein FliJ